jgi:hypothetical protein
MGLLATTTMHGARPAGPLPGDTVVQGIVARVSDDSVLASIVRLQAFYTRYEESESCVAAVNWALDRMSAYRCDSVYADEFDTLYDPSAIGVKVGRLNPRLVFIICGHIDDICDPLDHAPGADDNASGATAVLEVCRVLFRHDLDYTLRFICFNAEEGGSVGAMWYAYRARQRGDSILGVFNFDMISHGDTGYDSVRVEGRTADSALVGTYCAMADSYTSLQYHPVVSDTLNEFESDHGPFWVEQYRAAYVREAQYPPSHHTLLDSVGPYRYPNCGTNNAPLAAEVIRAAAATVARLAGARPLAITENPAPPARTASLTLRSSNPASGGFRVSFSLSKPGHVSLKLYDVMGKLVSNLASGFCSAGACDFRLPAVGNPLSAGVYLLRFDTDGCQTTQKLVIE